MKRKLPIPVMVILVFAFLLPSTWAAEVFSVLDPRGNQLPIEMVPLTTKRPKSLEGKWR